jgi:hypothetical protein
MQAGVQEVGGPLEDSQHLPEQSSPTQPPPTAPASRQQGQRQVQRQQQQQQQQQRQRQRQQQQPSALPALLSSLAAAGHLSPLQVGLALALAEELEVPPHSHGTFCAGLLAVLWEASAEEEGWVEAVAWQQVLGAVAQAGGQARREAALRWLDLILACWKVHLPEAR